MAKIHCEVKGLQPYYFNRQVEGAVPKTLEQNVQRALDLVYCDGETTNSFRVPDITGSYNVKSGTLFMPGNQYRGCMRGSMSLFKMKVEKSNKRAIDLLNASVFIEPHWPRFVPKLKMKDIKIEPHWIITNQATGQGQTKYFACIDKGWKMEFDIEHVGLLDISFLQTALVNGGLYCGVGGRRIHGMGRFEVVKFEPVG